MSEICSICGKTREWNTAWWGDFRGLTLCMECHNKYIYTCGCCGGRFDTRQVPKSDTTIRGLVLCPMCAEKVVSKCSNCGKKDFEFTLSPKGKPVCADCINHAISCYHHAQSSFPFYAHREKGNYKSKQTCNGGLYFGMELEMDREQATRKGEPNWYKWALIDLVKLGKKEFYFETDCSLGYDGAELITYPHTIDAFYAMNWEAILKKARANGYRSHNSGKCGLHLHFNRAFFGSTLEERTENIAKILVFYNIFWDDLVKFSRRTNPSEWAGRPSIGLTSSESDNIGKVIESDDNKKKIENNAKQSAGCSGGYRYKAVNLCPRNTVEFRLMRGTLRYETFMATIDFSINVVLKAKELDWKQVWDYKNWLKDCKKETIEYMEERHCFEGMWDSGVNTSVSQPSEIIEEDNGGEE